MKTFLPLLITLAAALPASAQDPIDRKIKIGPALGYIDAKGADDPSWFAGLAARMDLTEWLGAEASITSRHDEFLDGLATVDQVPIQLTGIFYPPVMKGPGPRPYVLGGFGWYHVRTDYDSSLGLDTETSTATGLHFGAGVEIPLGPMATGFADVRYIFIDEPGVDNSNLEDENWDTIQFALGVLFKI